VFPPFARELLVGRGDQVTTGPGSEVAEDRGFEVDS
jgi:hypothetical protein